MRVLIALVLALALSGCAEKPADRRLPDLTLSSLTDGEDIELRSLRGPLVINLWASWCGPCKKELPLYATFAREYDGRVDVLGIDWRDVKPDKARRMAREAKVGFPNLVDLDGEFASRALPRLVLVDEQGDVVFSAYREIKSLTELEGLVAKHLGVKA